FLLHLPSFPTRRSSDLAMFFFRHHIRSTVGRVFAIIVPAFAAFWTLSSLALTASDYFGLAGDLRHGRCEVVEGTVEQFDPMPYTDRKSTRLNSSYGSIS